MEKIFSISLKLNFTPNTNTLGLSLTEIVDQS